MSLSASVHHTTANFHREPKWEPPRRGLGIASLCLSGTGVLVLAWVFASAHRSPITVGAISWLALSVTFSLGGLQGARWGFGSQRATDTKRMFGEDVLAVFTRVDDIAAQQEKLAEQVGEFAESERADVAEMRKQLSDVSLDQGSRIEHIESALERIERRLAVLAGDNVIDIQTARDLADLNERRRNKDS